MAATAEAPVTHALRPEQARKLADAEGAVAAAQAVLEQAEEDRDKLRKRYRSRIPSKHAITVGGVTIKVTPYSYDSFSLKRYTAAGHRITKAMQSAMEMVSQERWTVKREVRS